MPSVEQRTSDQTALTKTTPPSQASLSSDIKASFNLLAKAVQLSEPRLTSRVLRQLPSLRKRLQSSEAPAQLHDLIQTLPKNSKVRDVLLTYVTPNSMDLEPKHVKAEDEKSSGPNAISAARGVIASQSEALPELEVFLSILVIVMLLDRSNLSTGFEFSTRMTVDYLPHQNRRSLDPLAARLWFYHARLAELLETSGQVAGAWEATRPALMTAHRTATLRRDEDTQATILNLMMRNYLHYDLWDQADRLLGNTEFPEFGLQATVGAGGHVPPAQVARWLYYLGRIRAIQLNYTDAHTHLQLSIRRAPAAEVAPGFYQTSHKLFVVVELLMGDIPDRALFRHAVLKKALQPYFEVVQAVKAGDVAQFERALSAHGRRFVADATYTLILRLRHNVIKTALRTISLAYSRIHLSDVSLKLRLDSEEDAEYIVAKAIRDGVIEATLDHEKGFMQSREVTDVHASNEPQEAFQQRISFCLKLHNESIKAMRFPLDAHRKELASAEEARGRERELAQDILEGEEAPDDDADPGAGF